MERPTRNSIKAERIAEELLDHLHDYHDVEKTDHVLEDLTDVLEYSISYGGYEIAKELEEKKMWHMDAQMVDALDQAWSIRHKLHWQILKKWVKHHNIKPKLSVGDKVKAYRKRDLYENDKDVEDVIKDGEIIAIDHNTAKYVVYVPSEGHVKEGPGTHGWVIPFEDLEEINDLHKDQSFLKKIVTNIKNLISKSVNKFKTT